MVTMVGIMQGTVTCITLCSREAPSRAAASWSSVLAEVIAATKIMEL